MCHRTTNLEHEDNRNAELLQAEPLCQPLPAAPAEWWPEMQDLDDFIFHWETQAPSVSDR